MGTGKATMFAAYSQGTLSAEEAYEMELERLAAGGDVVDEPIKPQGRASPASTTGSSPNKKQSRGKQAGADRRRISDPIPVGSDFDNPWDAMGLAKTQETVVDDADAERADAAFKGAAAYQDWKNMKVGDKRRSQQRISNDSTGTTAAGKSSSHSSKVAPASTLPASSQPRSAWASTTSSPEPLADVRHSSFARPLGDGKNSYFSFCLCHLCWGTGVTALRKHGPDDFSLNCCAISTFLHCGSLFMARGQTQKQVRPAQPVTKSLGPAATTEMDQRGLWT